MGIKHIKVIGLLSLTYCVISLSAAGSHQKQSALTVVENNEQEEEKSEATVEDEQDSEDLEVFYPTDQWQTVRPGQAVPAGLHIRLNLQTGEKEAKIPDDEKESLSNMKYWKQGKRHGIMNTDAKSFTAQELKKALKKFKQETVPSADEEKLRKEKVKQVFRPIEEIKKEFKDLNMLIETDYEIIKKIVDKFNSSSSTLDEKIEALKNLEYYVHQVDNAQDLVSLGGFHLVINALNSTEPILKEHAAFVLGSAVSSNPKVQIEAVDGGALQKLLVLLATEQSVAIKKKALFALSSILRHFPYAQEKFLKMGGLQILGQLFQTKGMEQLRVRAVTLLYDLLMEKMLLHSTEADSKQMKEKISQYNQVNLLPVMLEQGWCTLISHLLTAPEHDTREKVLKTVDIIALSCKEEFNKDPVFNTTMFRLKSEYETLATAEHNAGEEDTYFMEILSTIENIMQQLNMVNSSSVFGLQ
ncbi:nucleotide exchange factor SIL1 [Protopterus annectens]|uniref:nucleotide exchange factor SIL1 n=1 Tax=Protopterus annectens TaxID=7888 RepID=UPI001CF9FC8B|nr:nucleotide exchange factor SIL1 [Protopterus annectens]XP_043924945.1 nucleotide exchange factor SIL1 [Protopterus annectens]XP_043924946.1 nucleotide exchange factor SIL1 [Protopterus annectens]